MAFAIHTFDTTEEAYDATQCDDNISRGDILIIESEKVVGIADTWPIAVTDFTGELHGVQGTKQDGIVIGYTDDKTHEYYVHLDLAFEIAQAYGWQATDKRK